MDWNNFISFMVGVLVVVIFWLIYSPPCLVIKDTKL